MLHNLTNNGGYVVLKQITQNIEDGDTGKKCQKPALQQKATDDDDSIIRLSVQESFTRWRQLRLDFDSTAVRLVIKSH